VVKEFWRKTASGIAWGHQKLLLPLEGSAPQYVVPWTHPSPQPKRHLDWFSHFSTARGYVQQTHTDCTIQHWWIASWTDATMCYIQAHRPQNTSSSDTPHQCTVCIQCSLITTTATMTNGSWPRVFVVQVRDCGSPEPQRVQLCAVPAATPPHHTVTNFSQKTTKQDTNYCCCCCCCCYYTRLTTPFSAQPG